MLEVREDLQRSRDARTIAAQQEWRQHAIAIAQQDVSADDVGEEIDRLLIRLNLHDEAMIADVEAYREYIEIVARRESFSEKRPEHEALLAKAKKKVAKLTQERESWEHRSRVAEQQRIEACRPFGQDDRDGKRIGTIELANPRLFGEIADG